MDILKASTNWVKSELFSTPFFILFGVLFVLASIGFWQWGKTEVAKAYVIPTLVGGVVLIIIGLGLYFTNKGRLANFPAMYESDSVALVRSEITRSEGTLKEYQTIVFTIIPLIIIVCSVGIMLFDTPVWRASFITIIAILVVILLIDGTAYARMNTYHQQLLSLGKM
jgi:hypothetical protein